MKRFTMELGGHAPAIVFDDADVGHREPVAGWCEIPQRRSGLRVAHAVPGAGESVRTVRQRIRSAQQSGSRSATAWKPATNDGTDGQSPSHHRDGNVHRRRDATGRDAVQAGGHRIGNKGNFFEPTVLTDVPKDARVMHEEPFGPLAIISPFSGFDEVVTEANRLPYGLASYAYTRSARTANAIAAAVESGMISINHHGLALAGSALRWSEGFRLCMDRRPATRAPGDQGDRAGKLVRRPRAGWRWKASAVRR